VFQESNGKSKGCGLVTYQSRKEAQRAIRELHESELDGRKIFVAEDKRDGAESHGGRASGDTRSGGGGGVAQLYVGNLSFDTSWQDLKDYFRKCGSVEKAEVPENQEGRKKGFGLVRFTNPQDASAAIRQLDGVEFQGRRLDVRWDRDSNSNDKSSSSKPERSGGGHNDDHREDRQGSSTVFVGNLSFDTSWQELKDFCRKCGTVEHTEIPEKDGRKRGYGLVRFVNRRDALGAIRTLDGVEFQGRRLEVRMDNRDESLPKSGGGAVGRANNDEASEASTTIYVGNLSFDASWQELKDFFRKCGNVENADVPEKDGRKRGYGLVRFTNHRDAAEAVRKLDGAEFQGRRLEVRMDRAATGSKTQDNAMPAHKGNGSADYDGQSLFVGNLPFDVSWQDLKDHFKQCGKVDHSKVIEGPDGRKKGFGIIKYFDARDAEQAIRRLDGVEFRGRKLQVRFDERR
jgi:RNA recognition motif-containing protein